MCKNCEELRAKCINLFLLADASNREEIEAKIEVINETLDSMGFIVIEKLG